MQQVFAQASSVVGTVQNTVLPSVYAAPGGVITLLTNILRVFFVAAGILAFLNLIIAGFQFMTAGGDSKAVSNAWSRIWQSLLGLILIVGSFALASVFGYLLFGRADFILNPKIYTP